MICKELLLGVHLRKQPSWAATGNAAGHRGQLREPQRGQGRREARLEGLGPLTHMPILVPTRQVLRLLITAWERRLIFTIGTSSTTGESDTVVWNEIHHKTEFGSNLTGHGYPDASYLDNVLAELTAQGVSEAAAKA